MGETLQRRTYCPSCKNGEVIPKWVNITKVRAVDDALPATYDQNPCIRYQTVQYEQDNGVGSCAAITTGCEKCGQWLMGGDKNGLSAQEIDDTVDDIMECAANDATHTTSDHNCYEKSGTVDMRQTERKGGQWILARKNWHGRFKILSNDGCGKDPNIPAEQIKYLTQKTVTNYRVEEFDEININPSIITEQTLSITSSIDRLTGIETRTKVGDAVQYNGGYVGASADCNLSIFVPTIGDVSGESLSEFKDALKASLPDEGDPNPAWPSPSGKKLTINEISQTDTSFIVDYDYVNIGVTGYVLISQRIEIILSAPYTSSEVYEDCIQMLKSWDTSDFSLANLREDEKLALSPLIIRDEIPAAAPSLSFVFTMPDYSLPQVAGEWQTMPWEDSNSYIWLTDVGGLDGNYNTAGGNTIVRGMRTGEIIAHNQAGSEGHFWFAAQVKERRTDNCGGSSDNIGWVDLGYGESSAKDTNPSQEASGLLPAVTLRWMNDIEAQRDYTPALCNGNAANPCGNFPQSFITQGGGRIVGGKYVEAAFEWPAVNYGRPCGVDRYAVDQTTVCAIQSGTCESGTVTVFKTQNAAAPLAAGGLAVDDYIASDAEGFYKITGISDNLDGTFNVTVGAKIENLPTGWEMPSCPIDDSAAPAANYIGRLRWVNYVRNSATITMPSPWCGRQAVTPSESAGVVTLTQAGGFTNYLKDVTTGQLPALKIYNSAMTLLDTIAGTSVTRNGDNSVSFTHAAMPTSAYLVYDGYAWADYDDTPQHTGIHATYDFNHRAAQSGYTSPPTWYDDVAGCTNGTLTQFSYDFLACRSMVGVVPFYSQVVPPPSIPNPSSPPPAPLPLEDFTNDTLHPMPDYIGFDDVFGSHWQGKVLMTMPDPFWQAPFVPDGGLGVGETMELREDDGSGNSSTGGPNYVVYHAHRRWVEASNIIPAGKYLPDGISLWYANPIAPYNFIATEGTGFSGGISLVNDGGGAWHYQSLETVYGFRNRACANIAGTGNFYEYYQEFVQC